MNRWLVILVNLNLLAGARWGGAAEPHFVSLGDLNRRGVHFTVTGQGAADDLSHQRYFFPATSSAGPQVWLATTDMTARAIPSDPSVRAPTGLSQFTPADDCVVFVGDGGDGPELWRATTSGLTPLAELQFGGQHPPPTIIGSGEGRVYLTTPHPTQSALIRLWWTNGGAITQVGDFAEISHMSVVDNVLLFVAKPNPGSNDRFLRQASGSQLRTIIQVAGTSVPAAPPGPLYAVTDDNRIYYRGRATTGSDWELFRTSVYGTVTELVKDIVPGAAGSNPGAFTAVGNTVYFSADTPGEGRELWKTTGLAATTALVADLRAGAASSNPRDLRSTGLGLFFLAAGADGNFDLWSAGDFAGAVPAHNLNLGPEEQLIAPTIRTSTQMWYWSQQGDDAELYEAVLGGGGHVITEAPFSDVRQMWTASTPGGPDTFVIARSSEGHDPDPAYKLYSLDAASPRLVGTFTNPRWPATWSNGNAQLITADLDGGTGLFRIYSTSIPWRVESHSEENQGSFPREFTEFAGDLYFSAVDHATGKRQLHGSNGTATSSLLLASDDPADLTTFQNRLYFHALDHTSSPQRRALAWLEIVNDAWQVTMPQGAGASEVLQIATLGDWLYTLVDTNIGGEQLLKVMDEDHDVVETISFLKDANQKGLDQFMPGDTWLFMVAPFGAGREVYAIKDGDWAGHKTTGWINDNPDANPKIVGTLGDTVLFRAHDGTAEFFWAWHPNDAAPRKLGATLPRLRADGKLRTPSGAPYHGRFYFTAETGAAGLWSTDGLTQSLLDDGGHEVRSPEAITLFQGMLYYISGSSLRSVDSNHEPSFTLAPINIHDAGRLVAAGNHLYIILHNDALPPFFEGATTLLLFDGTSSVNQVGGRDGNLSPFSLSEGYKPEFGVFKNHLVIGRQPSYPMDGHRTGVEPWLVNHLPETGLLRIFPGLRNQPVTLTYEQIIAGHPMTDRDGDPLRLILDSNGNPAPGTLKINGDLYDDTPREIHPGDVFVWQPVTGSHGLQSMLSLSLRDFLDAREPVINVDARLQRPVDLWSESKFTAEEHMIPEFTLPETDAEFDGIPNGLEYVMGLDPKVNDGSPVTTLGVQQTPEGARLMFRFIRIASLADDCRLNIELSTTPAPDAGTVTFSLASKLGNAAWTVPEQFKADSGMGLVPMLEGLVQETTLPDGRIQVDVTCPGILEDWGPRAFVWLRPEL